MAKTSDITLGDNTRIRILYEDRAVIAVDKPPGWMLAPSTWDRTGRNLQRAIESSIQGSDFWARCRQLKYLRFIHRLDADTSGVLLLARSQGVLRLYGRLFETRQVEKTYLAVVHNVPRQEKWECELPIGNDTGERGLMRIGGNGAREAFTRFERLEVMGETALVRAQPFTGRTHQIRLHLMATGHPILGDVLYGNEEPLNSPEKMRPALALRALQLSYKDPFTRRPIHIKAPDVAFRRQFGYAPGTQGMKPEIRNLKRT